MADSPSARLRFPDSRRIKQGRDFRQIRSQGGRLVNGCLIANWLPLPSGSSSRLGVVTSRRIGNAVARNRARRLLREAFRLNQAELLKPVDLVVIARESIVGKRFSDVERDFLRALRQARLLPAL